MATYAAIYVVATQEGGFFNRLAVAVAYAAQDVLAENPATPNHAQRVSWAGKALGDPLSMARKMVYSVLSVPAIDVAWPAVSDTQIKTAVLGLVDTFAAI